MTKGRHKTPRNGVLSLECDGRILFIVLVLVGIGASLVASSSSFFAGGEFADHFALMRRHVMRSAIALAVLLLALKVDYRIYRKLAPAFLVLGVTLLLGLFVFGKAIRETLRWYSIPRLHATLQPSEFARTALVFFLAYWVTKRGSEIRDLKRGFLPAAAMVILVVGLIAAAPNYGTATATLTIAFVMFWLGGARVVHMVGFGGAIALAAAVRLVNEPYVRERIGAFFNPGQSVTGDNWQVYQSLVGLGSGGIAGVGLGNSQQQLSWLPDSYTDFIFSIVGEELGLVGTLVVSALFLLLVLRALKISRHCNDTFGEMLVLGLGTSIFVYATLNMYVATGMFPVTGLPLPFLSYGGSALIVNAFAMGVLLNVSKKRGSNGTKRGTVRVRHQRAAAGAV